MQLDGWSLKTMQKHPCYHYTRLPVTFSPVKIEEARNKRHASHPGKPSGLVWLASSIGDLEESVCGKKTKKKRKEK